MALEVNGNRSECFESSRSIRQGCPLAPALFVIVAEALHYLLRDESILPKVCGPLLPNGDELSNMKFANDTSILFELIEENMYHLMTKLDQFYVASGSKISIDKSIILGWDPISP